MAQTPSEVRVLHLEIRLKELENENLKLKENNPAKVAKEKFLRQIAIGFLIMAALWSFAIFTMLCAVIFWPELGEVLDQFIVGFGSLATGVFLGSSAQKFLDKMFD